MPATIKTVYEAYMKAPLSIIKKEKGLMMTCFRLGYEGKDKPTWLSKTDLAYGAYKAGVKRLSKKEKTNVSQ